jgi:serine/threonine-protein kinase PpkA
MDGRELRATRRVVDTARRGGQERPFAVRVFAAWALALAWAGSAHAEGICGGIQCSTDSGACIVSDSGLPLRVLVKPDANIFDKPEASAGVVRGNMEPFSVLYIQEALYCEKETGDAFNSPVWYKVGYSQSETAGYMSANATVQWRNGMSLAYTNPGASERRRVIMFNEWNAIDGFIEKATSGAMDVGKVYEGILSGKEIPPGVTAIESAKWIDVDRKIYLLPILQFEDLAQYYPEGDFRALQVAALSSKTKGGGGTQCDLQAKDAEQCLAEQRGSGEVGAIDIVWVIDMTLSMQPYIDAVATAVRSATNSIREQAGEEDKVRFGLVGFRDDVEEAPWLEFVSKNFTPELLARKDFEALMGEGMIKAAEKSTGDFPEEVFVGVREGARSAWREKSMKVVILIGDASSHALGHPKNTANLSEDAVKALIGEQQIYLSAILLSNPDSAADSTVAEKQFMTLSQLDASSAYHRVEVSKSDNGGEKLALALRDVTSQILEFAATGDFSKVAGRDDDSGVAAAVKKAVRAAAVDYLGQEADPPSNITAWVADRDIGALEKQAFEVRVVTTRKDIQELKQLITALLASVREGTKASSGFIEDATGASASAAMDLAIEGSQKFKESGLVPKWINSLPYQSQALSLSKEAFLQLPPDDRTKFEERLAELTNTYEQVLSDTDAWYYLNDKDVQDGQVHLLPLRLLP